MVSFGRIKVVVSAGQYRTSAADRVNDRTVWIAGAREEMVFGYRIDYRPRRVEAAASWGIAG
jgi:hypothetical protein